MRRALAALLLLVVPACRSEPRPSSPPPPPAPPPSSAPALASSSPSSSSLSVFLAGEPVEAATPRRYRDIHAFCMEYVTRSTTELREAGGVPHLRPTTPACRAGNLPVPFTGDSVFKRALAVVVDSGLSSESRVLVEMADGLEETPIDWGYRNLHAAQSVPYATTLESLRIEGGKLVAVVGREHVWVFDDASGDAGAPEWFLVRGVIACDAGPSLSCRSWFTDARAPWLGMKRRAFDAKASWDRIPWSHPPPSFAFAPGGGLTITPP